MPKVVHHESRRVEVAEAAWRVIARGGIAAATVRDIASEAGCSTGALAHYFRGKGDLLLYALQLAWNRAAERMASSSRDLTGFEALRSVLMEALPLDEERRVEWQIWVSFWGRAASDSSLADEQRKRYALWRGLMRSLIQACQREGSVRKDVDAEKEADMIVAFVDGIGTQATLESDYLSTQRQTALIDRYLALLATDGL